MQALILAGGFGSRLMPVVNDRPKIMAEVGGKPFLEVLITYLRQQNISEVILALGYLSQYVKNYFQDGRKHGINIQYSVEDFPLGTAGAIKNAQKLLKNNFFVVNGDTFLDVDFAKVRAFHEEKNAEITMVVTKKGEKKERGLVEFDSCLRIRSFQENSENSPNTNSYTNAGVYLLNKTLCSTIKKGEKISLEKEIFPSVATRLHMYAYVTEKEYIDIGTPDRYERAQILLKSL
jgi:D-glycero-alpha-D-manno-heptose 1-phosphate guanylyltransferase